MNVSVVAQVGNLLYRRLVIGAPATVLRHHTVSGLPIRDTADCQSALRGAAVADDLRDIVELQEKEEGMDK